MGGQEKRGSMQQPTSFLPRDNSVRILAAIVLLAAISAAETLLAADMSGSYDYSRWPDDFLLACGEYERVRMFASRSPLLTATVVAACGMLALMLSEAFWDRLRNTRRRILDARQGLHAAGIAMDEITEGFRQLLAGLVAVAVIADLFILRPTSMFLIR